MSMRATASSFSVDTLAPLVIMFEQAGFDADQARNMAETLWHLEAFAEIQSRQPYRAAFKTHVTGRYAQQVEDQLAQQDAEALAKQAFYEYWQQSHTAACSVRRPDVAPEFRPNGNHSVRPISEHCCLAAPATQVLALAVAGRVYADTMTAHFQPSSRRRAKSAPSVQAQPELARQLDYVVMQPWAYYEEGLRLLVERYWVAETPDGQLLPSDALPELLCQALSAQQAAR